MENNMEATVNSILEKIARGYNIAKQEWKADRRNLFKDGKFLGYYEMKETFLKYLSSEDSVNSALEAVARLYTRTKEEWKADRSNAFKDGKFLACFEVLEMIPAI